MSMDITAKALHAAYRLLSGLAVWGALLPLQLLAALSGRSSLAELRQRMAWDLPRIPDPGPRLLLHAVSAGEMAAARPLLGALAEIQPQVQILLSSGNAAGLALARDICRTIPGSRLLGPLPWDRRRALRRWLKHLRPDLVAVVETELWPELFRACHHLEIPLALVNGRIYPRDLARYRLVRPLMRHTLACASLLGVQDDAEVQRFTAIGAPTQTLRVMGNSKFDAALEASRVPEQGLGAPLLLGVSTHAPEEQWLMRAFGRLRHRHPDLRLVLAPRALNRSHRLLGQARSRGWAATTWSASEGRGDWKLLVMDTFGRLAPCYAAAELVFVGGSLAPRGGHNPLEAAALGRPVLVGPHTDHFRRPVALLEAAGALLQVAGPQELLDTMERLMDDPAHRERMGQAARAVVEANGGAAREYARALVQLMRDNSDTEQALPRDRPADRRFRAPQQSSAPPAVGGTATRGAG